MKIYIFKATLKIKKKQQKYQIAFSTLSPSVDDLECSLVRHLGFFLRVLVLMTSSESSTFCSCSFCSVSRFNGGKTSTTDSLRFNLTGSTLKSMKFLFSSSSLSIFGICSEPGSCGFTMVGVIVFSIKSIVSITRGGGIRGDDGRANSVFGVAESVLDVGDGFGVSL